MITLNQEEELYILQIGKEGYELSYDPEHFVHVLSFLTEQKITGVNCCECENHIRPNNVYFCLNQGKFRCKNCVIHKHHITLLEADPEHYDYKVIIQQPNLSKEINAKKEVIEE